MSGKELQQILLSDLGVSTQVAKIRSGFKIHASSLESSIKILRFFQKFKFRKLILTVNSIDDCIISKIE